MKILITLALFFFSLISYSQITLFDVLSLENKSFQETQAFLFEQYTIIDDSKEYYYFPIKKCNPPEYGEDGCRWICTEPNHLDALRSKYPLDKVIFKKSSNQEKIIKDGYWMLDSNVFKSQSWFNSLMV